jgi:hypothetical protein
MKLNDVRKLAIRQQLRVCFALSSGMKCVVDEHGIARVPGLKAPPEFDLEDEFGRAVQFDLEPAAAKAAGVRRLARQDLAALAGQAVGNAVHADEQEE